MRRFYIDLAVGMFVLLGICSLAFLALKVAARSNYSLTNDQNYTIYAKFSNIGSLRVAAPIKVSGFIVGHVTGIDLDSKSYQAIVTMKINNKYHFSSDTSAQILTTGLLGEQYVALQSGADDSYLKNGDFVNLTSSAMILEDLIGKFMTNVSNNK